MFPLGGTTRSNSTGPSRHAGGLPPVPNYSVLRIKAPPLRGAGPALPAPGSALAEARPARPRRPDRMRGLIR
jgi:hypothetical protein